MANTPIQSPEIRALIRAGKEREKIKVADKRKDPGCVIRISPAALGTLESLEKQTGQSKRYLASELIVQGVNLIEFVPEACIDCEYADRCTIESGCLKGD